VGSRFDRAGYRRKVPKTPPSITFA
jgi:hypothetical protein